MDSDEVMKAHDGHLFIKHYGRWFVVLAVFDNDDAANAYMERSERAAALVTHGKFVFLADKRDMGAATPSL